MSDKTKVKEQCWDELYTLWFECLNCGSCDITEGYNYCPNCGKEIYRECKEIKPSDIRMEKLISELSVKDFMQYMKDNGLGMESIR